MSLLNKKIISPLTKGVHTVRLIDQKEGVTRTTPDGKGGEEYIAIVVKCDNENFTRDSFSDPGMCFLKEGVALQKFSREVITQLSKKPEDLAELFAVLKQTNVIVQVGENTNVGTGKVYPNFSWTAPAAAPAPEAPPAELDPETKLA